MTKHKQPPVPDEADYTAIRTEHGVTLQTGLLKEESSNHPGAFQIRITKEPTRFRNQSCYAAHIYQCSTPPRARALVSRRFSHKGDPAVKYEAFCEILGAAVMSTLEQNQP